MRFLTRRTVAAALSLAVLAGCQSSGPIGRPDRYIKPVVAVESFENRAPFPLKWNLGEGMADQLLASLAKSERVTLVSRSSLPAVFQELEMQKDPHFRPEGRVARGRLKNAQYLVRGTVVDFTHMAGGALYFFRGLSRGSTSANVAVVTLAVSVVNVETREMVTRTFSGKAWAAELSLQAVYKDTAFGGAAFYKTPLGKATEDALWDAVHWVVKQIASDEWTPRIALIENGKVFLTGGADRRMRPGDEVEVYETGAPIFDPATGDQIGEGPERVIGRVRVVEVRNKLSVAEIVSGLEFRVGQLGRRVKTPGTPGGGKVYVTE